MVIEKVNTHRNCPTVNREVSGPNIQALDNSPTSRHLVGLLSTTRARRSKSGMKPSADACSYHEGMLAFYPHYQGCTTNGLTLSSANFGEKPSQAATTSKVHSARKKARVDGEARFQGLLPDVDNSCRITTIPRVTPLRQNQRPGTMILKHSPAHSIIPTAHHPSETHQAEPNLSKNPRHQASRPGQQPFCIKPFSHPVTRPRREDWFVIKPRRSVKRQFPRRSFQVFCPTSPEPDRVRMRWKDQWCKSNSTTRVTRPSNLCSAYTGLIIHTDIFERNLCSQILGRNFQSTTCITS